MTIQLSQASTESVQASPILPLKYLAFTLGREEYGIDILRVQEIRSYEAVTGIANAPEYVKGIMNLRGVIVPIIDMRVKFKLGAPTHDQFAVVVILNFGKRTIGMIVDSVSDVVTLHAEQIKPAPQVGADGNADYLIGLGAINERMLILVDIGRLMSSREIGMLDKLAD